MLIVGPIIFGFIFGVVVGLTMKNNPDNPIKFTKSSYIVILIAAILVAWRLGPVPFYTDLPIATSFVSGMFGLIIGKTISHIT
jgi:energy-converting hydrogenase B subunit J